MTQYTIKHRLNDSVLYEGQAESLKALLQQAVAEEADLWGADLGEANLGGADLRRADLRGANLWDADLGGANLEEAKSHNLFIPKIPNIHRAVYEAVTAKGHKLDMGDWHSCESTHCRAGWVVTLAGEEGKNLEARLSTGTAAALIYQQSDPTMKRVPNWYCSDDEAMADIKRLAGVNP